MTRGYLQKIFILTIFLNQLSEIYCKRKYIPKKCQLKKTWDYHHVNEWYINHPECGGKFQSPVNINTDSIQEEIETAITFKDHDLVPNRMILQNNGHTVAIEPVWNYKAPSMKGGPLNGTYILDSIHFHWSSTNSRGSEHTINGKKFPLEMHMVHYKQDYCSVKDALKEADGLAVIGMIFQINNRNDGSVLNPIVENIYRTTKINEKSSIRPFSLKAFNLDNEIKLITYSGSLTTPPCSQTVTWLITGKIHKVTNKQMEAFRLVKFAHGDKENNRPVQSLNKREFKIVKGPICRI